MRVERPVKDNISPKPPVTQVPQKPTDGEPTAKQNSLPTPTQQSKHIRLSALIPLNHWVELIVYFLNTIQIFILIILYLEKLQESTSALCII